MKHLLFGVPLIFLIQFAIAQNVGIGTITPSEKLEVHNAVNSNLKISSADYNDTSRLILSNRNISNQGTDFNINAIREEGLLITTKSDLVNNNNDSLFVLKSSGRLGLGVKNPASRLDVNGGERILGFNTLEFGAGVTGKEPNAGKIGYRTFSTNALDIVGAGAGTTDRQIYFFAEGGSYFSGPINISSNLQINGNSGTTGQVLTSNGTGSPSWQPTSFSNTTRFDATGTNGAFYYSDLNFTTVYNTNTTDVSVGVSSIAIYKAGLYHLEGSVEVQADYFPNAAYPPFYYLYFSTNTGHYVQILRENYVKDGSVISAQERYNLAKPFSLDMYLTAGTLIYLKPVPYPNTGSPAPIFSYTVDFRGYLISP